jgi:hypothetical protein
VHGNRGFSRAAFFISYNDNMRHVLGPLICLLASAKMLLSDYMWRCNPMKAQPRNIGKTAINQ